ncbi:MAG: hypothetical protein ACK4MM_04620 [Fervidobacterium sp.]
MHSLHSSPHIDPEKLSQLVERFGRLSRYYVVVIPSNVEYRDDFIEKLYVFVKNRGGDIYPTYFSVEEVLVPLATVLYERGIFLDELSDEEVERIINEILDVMDQLEYPMDQDDITNVLRGYFIAKDKMIHEQHIHPKEF